jgi:serine O-acetyltransferase
MRRSLINQIVEDWEAHDRDFTRPGFQAMAVYRFGTWRMGIGPKVLRAPLSVLYRTLYRSVRNLYGIELPYTARIGRRVVIEHQSGIVIHGHAEIGDDCTIRQDVTIGNRRADRPLDAPRLGKRVTLGAGAKVLGPVHIGDDAKIGANAVVCDDIPAGAVAIGVPARVVGAGAREGAVS